MDCRHRLRCCVKDVALVKQDVLKASGASGVMICKGDGVCRWCTVPRWRSSKAKLEDYLEKYTKTSAATAGTRPGSSSRNPGSSLQRPPCCLPELAPSSRWPEWKDGSLQRIALGDGIAIGPATVN